MLKKFLLIAFLLINCNFSFSNENLLQQIEAGNKFYSNQEYDNAINSYNAVLNEGFEAPELYYNLGNAFYKKGEIAQAILNYERAKILAPEDEDISYNLQIAQTVIVDKIEIVPEFIMKTWYRLFIDIFSSQTWSLLSIFTFISGLSCLLWFLFSSSVAVKKTTFLVAVILMITSFTSIIAARTQSDRINNRNTAIVFEPSVTVKSSPAVDATDIFVIHEGTKITIRDEFNKGEEEWIEIRLSDGNVGWIKKSAVEVI